MTQSESVIHGQGYHGRACWDGWLRHLVAGELEQGFRAPGGWRLAEAVAG